MGSLFVVLTLMKKIFPLLVIFGAIFFLYFRMLAPTVAPQADSGELVTVAATLGIAHPPGYPLYTLLAFAFTKIPWGSVAWRVNLMSAVFQVATLLVVFLIVKHLTKSVLVSLVTILILALSYTFWLYSLVAEVFALNNFLAVAIVYVALTVRPKLLLLLALFLGLGLSNHHTIILILPAVVYLVFPFIKKIVVERNFFLLVRLGFLMTLALALGLAPYLYIVWRAKTAIVPVAWAYPTSLPEIWRMFTRADYGTFSSVATVDPSLATLADKFGQILTYFRLLWDDFSLVGIILAVVGLLYSWFKNRRSAVFILLGFLFSGPLFLSYANFPFKEFTGTGLTVVERFYLLPNLFLVLAMGLGLNFVVKLLRKRTIFLLLFALSLVFYLVRLGVLHYGLVDQHDNYLAWEFGKNIVSGVPPWSLIFLQGDIPTFTAFYARYVEKIGPDVEFITANQVLFDNRYRYLSSVRPDLNLGFPQAASPEGVLSANLTFADWYFFGPPGFKLEEVTSSPSGLLFKIIKPREILSLADWKAENEKMLASYALPSEKVVARAQTFADQAIISYYVRMFQYFGDICRSQGDFNCAEKHYVRGLALSPSDSLLSLYLGKVYQSLGQCALAEDRYRLVISQTGQMDKVVGSLADLAKDCFHDEAKAEYFARQKKIIEKTAGGDLKDL